MLIASGLLLGSSLGLLPTAAAAADDVLLQATPLILKDGRIANVSVHVVAFAQGQSALGSAIARELGLLSEDVATDCFLTAQVIGHVGSAEVAGNDSLHAHRLARSRADAVQASLIEGGLPAQAIASVWDWQFMVREPRATLWVFRLTPGEDCEGAPLDGAAPPALVAAAEAGEPATAAAAEPAGRAPAIRTETVAPPAAPSRAAEAMSQAPASPRPAPAAASQAPASASRAPAAAREAPASASRPPASSTSRAPEVARAAAATSPASVTARPAGPSPAPASVPTVTQALPAASPSPSTAPATPAQAPVGVVAALPGPAEAPAETRRPPAQVAVRPPAEAEARRPAGPQPRQPAAVAARVEPAPREPASLRTEERLAIVFPNNSSYFPPGITQQLRGMLRGLAPDRAYEVVLQSSVSGSKKVVGAETAEEAMRYNQWIAERRLERVREWLDRNAGGRALTFTQDYRANDESREVVVEVRPTG